MLKPLKHVQDLLAENAELAARLKLADERTGRLQHEIERLQGLKPENTRLSERVMLLEEEVRWFKEQFFGRSSQRSTSEMSAEQKLLFKGRGAERHRGGRRCASRPHDGHISSRTQGS